MVEVLTGIQCTGTPHLGNIIGAIKPAIELSNKYSSPSIFFMADMHAIININDPHIIKENTRSVTAAWIAFGANPEKDIVFKQSDVAEVLELTWYLNTVTPYSYLTKAHSFKDRKDKKIPINCGLFNYPVLMAADILLYDSKIIPVGKDQKQHIEITRNIANSFNLIHGKCFEVPEPFIDKDVELITGTDGRKMSKSYNNTLNIFQSEDLLLKNIKKIPSNSQPLEDPMDHKSCNIFKIFKAIATPDEVQTMKKNYEKGNFGYMKAKTILFETIIDKFKEQRTTFKHLIQNSKILDEYLSKGKDKAKKIASEKIKQIRKKFGFN